MHPNGGSTKIGGLFEDSLTEDEIFYKPLLHTDLDPLFIEVSLHAGNKKHKGSLHVSELDQIDRKKKIG
jgi:hypothetical protein